MSNDALSRVKLHPDGYVEVTLDPNNTEGGQKTGLMVSLLSSAFGLQPIYTDNEAEARAKAAHQTAK